MTMFETGPLIHAPDERIAVADLELASSFYRDLPARLLGEVVLKTPRARLAAADLHEASSSDPAIALLLHLPASLPRLIRHSPAAHAEL